MLTHAQDAERSLGDYGCAGRRLRRLLIVVGLAVGSALVLLCVLATLWPDRALENWLQAGGCRCYGWSAAWWCGRFPEWRDRVCPDPAATATGVFAGGLAKSGSGGLVVTTRQYSLVIPAGGGPYGLGVENRTDAASWHRRRIAEFTAVESTADSVNRSVSVRDLYASGFGYFLAFEADHNKGGGSPPGRVQGQLWWSGSCGPTLTDERPDVYRVEADHLARRRGSKSHSTIPAEDVVVSLTGRWSIGLWHFPGEYLCGLAGLLPLPEGAVIHVDPRGGNIPNFVPGWLEVAGIDVATTRIITGPVRIRKRLLVPEPCRCGDPDESHLSWLRSRIGAMLFSGTSVSRHARHRSLMLVRRTPDHAHNGRAFSATGYRNLYDALGRYAVRSDMAVTVFDDSVLPSVDVQLGFFAQAAVVVAPHGAGLVNLVAMLPRGESCVVELMLDSYENNMYREYAGRLGIHYVRGPDFSAGGVPDIPRTLEATARCIALIRGTPKHRPANRSSTDLQTKA